MKKLIGCLFGLFLISAIVRPAHAVNPVVSPKASYALTYTTTASTITATASTLYEVTLATGASAEYIAFFDTNTANGYNGVGTAVTATTVSAASGFKTRLFYTQATTGNTQIRFDPPLIFYYGIQVIDSAATGQALITYEPGVGSGQ